MSGVKEAERELEKVEEVLAMADRAIQISRLEHERLSADLAAATSEQAELSGPAVEPA
jgi:chromosome segregation ATPase